MIYTYILMFEQNKSVMNETLDKIEWNQRLEWFPKDSHPSCKHVAIICLTSFGLEPSREIHLLNLPRQGREGQMKGSRHHSHGAFTHQSVRTENPDPSDLSIESPC